MQIRTEDRVIAGDKSSGIYSSTIGRGRNWKQHQFSAIMCYTNIPIASRSLIKLGPDTWAMVTTSYCQLARGQLTLKGRCVGQKPNRTAIFSSSWSAHQDGIMSNAHERYFDFVFIYMPSESRTQALLECVDASRRRVLCRLMPAVVELMPLTQCSRRHYDARKTSRRRMDQRPD